VRTYRRARALGAHVRRTSTAIGRPHSSPWNRARGPLETEPARTARELHPGDVPRPVAALLALPRELGGVQRAGPEVAGLVGHKLCEDCAEGGREGLRVGLGLGVLVFWGLQGVSGFIFAGTALQRGGRWGWGWVLQGLGGLGGIQG
jgi:hypothetical protein